MCTYHFCVWGQIYRREAKRLTGRTARGCARALAEPSPSVGERPGVFMREGTLIPDTGGKKRTEGQSFGELHTANRSIREKVSVSRGVLVREGSREVGGRRSHANRHSRPNRKRKSPLSSRRKRPPTQKDQEKARAGGSEVPTLSKNSQRLRARPHRQPWAASRAQELGAKENKDCFLLLDLIFTRRGRSGRAGETEEISINL